MDKAFVQKVVDEAKGAEANLVIWDRRDTFTVEHKDLEGLEVADDHLRVSMQEGKATVYVVLDEVYKLVVERERARKSGPRAGFGAAAG